MFHINKILNRKPSSEKGQPTPESLSNKEVDDTLLEGEPSATEGFLCPACFSAFPTGTELQNHYESCHSGTVADGTSAYVCPACKMRLHSNIEFESHFQRHHATGQEKAEIENLQMQLQAMSEGKKILENELDKVQNQLLMSLKDVATNQALIEEQDLKINTLGDCLSKLKGEQETWLTENAHLTQLFKESKQEVNVLNTEVQKRLEENRTFAEKLKNSSNREDVKRLEYKIQDLLQNKEQMKITLDAKIREIEVLTSENKKIPGIETELEEMMDKYSACQKQLSAKEKDWMTLKLELEKQIESIQILKEDRDKLFAKIEEGEGANAAMSQLHQENINLQQQIQLKRSENASVLEELGSKLESLNLENYSLKTASQRMEKKCRLIKNALLSQRVKLKRISEEKNTLKTEIEKEKPLFGLIVLQTQNSLEKLQENVLSKDQAMKDMKAIVCYYEKQSELFLKSGIPITKYGKCPSNLQDYCNMLHQYTNQLAMKLLEKDNSLQKMDQTIEIKNKELTILAGQLEDCKLTNMKENTMFKELVKVNSELESEIKKKLLAIEELTGNLETKKKQIDDTQATLKEVTHMKQVLVEESASLSGKVTELVAEVSHLTVINGHLAEEKEMILQKFTEKAEAVEEMHTSYLALKESIKKIQIELDEERHNNKKIIDDLETAKELLVNKTCEYQKEKETLESNLELIISKVEEHISDASEKSMELLSESLITHEQLRALEAQTLERNQEWDTTLAHCKAQINLLTESTQTLRADLDTELHLHSQAECLLDEVNGIKLELEAKLENALDERKALLDRCLKCEADNEKLLEKNTDFCRKLDDTVAALHELGRENQALQVENTKHLERKWADDAEVDHCTACGKAFSVTIRKHHCRNCGNIFCNECSCKTATVASSKKPVRVCSLCHGELTK